MEDKDAEVQVRKIPSKMKVQENVSEPMVNTWLSKKQENDEVANLNEYNQ